MNKPTLLTDEQIDDIQFQYQDTKAGFQWLDFARAIEAAVNAKLEKMLGQQEPVGEAEPFRGMSLDHTQAVFLKKDVPVGTKLYTHPAPAPAQQREWVGLTDADLSVCDSDGVLLARYWERVLKEKNGA